MSHSTEINSFKDSHDLNLFFNSSHIRLRSVQEYFKDKGIFAFSDEKEAMADFASKFYLGKDSQDNLIKYTDIKVFPRLSGFILDVEVMDASIEDIYNYFDAHTGDLFKEVKESRITRIVPECNRINVYVQYKINEVTSYNIFDTVIKEANFEISKNDDLFTVTLMLNRDTDYAVIYGILTNIITKDSHLKLKLIESDLSKIPTTEKRHSFFKELLDKLNEVYEVNDIIKYSRNKAEDLNTADFFEGRHMKGNLEVKRMNINEIVDNLLARSAVLEGVNVILCNRNFKQLFVVQLLSKSNKGRFEIGMASDIKEIDNCNSISKIHTKDDIIDLESCHLTEYEKQEILKTIWNVVSKIFFEYRKELLASSKETL